MAGTKVDFKRELRELYSAKRDPTFVEVPELQFAMVDGHGDPNEAPSTPRRCRPSSRCPTQPGSR